MPSVKKRPERLLAWGLVVAVALAVFGMGLRKPYNNWDMVGYVAVALHAEGYSGKRLQQATYARVRQHVDTATFERLSRGDAYRSTVSTDASSLMQQLPFYDIRVLYMQLVRALHALGMDYPDALRMLSACFAACGVLLLGLLARAAGAPVWVVPLLAVFSGFADVARLSTPDAMACFFSLLTLYALLRRHALVHVLVMVLPLVRTEFVLLSLLVSGYTFLAGQRWRSMVSAALACMAYLWIVWTHHAYGWLTLFNTSLIRKTAYPASLLPSHALVDYIRPYVFTAYGLTSTPHFVVYALAVMGCWLCKKDIARSGDKRRFVAMFAIPLAFVILHLALFPANTYRYFVFATALLALWLLGEMRGVSSAVGVGCVNAGHPAPVAGNGPPHPGAPDAGDGRHASRVP